jgi:hypothetical protein
VRLTADSRLGVPGSTFISSRVIRVYLDLRVIGAVGPEGGPLAHDSEPTLAGRHQLIAICVHEEQKMQATLTSQPSNEDKTTAACVNRRYQSPTQRPAADSY